MKSWKRYAIDGRVHAVAIFALALVCRLIVAWRTGAFDAPETWGYAEIASSLLKGEGFRGAPWYLPSQITAHTPPLYPLILAALMGLFGGAGLKALVVLQCIAGSAACSLLVLLGRQFFDRATGLFAGLFLALYPHAAYLCCLIQPQSFGLLLLMGIVYLTARLFDRGQQGNALALGLLCGVTVLLDSSLAAYLPVALIVAFLSGLGDQGRRYWKYPAVVLVAVLLVLTPWTVRNAIRFGQLIPVNCGYGLSLYLGNFEAATGAINTMDGRPIWEAIPPAERLADRGMGFCRVDAKYGRQAGTILLQDKSATLKRFIAKTGAFWSPVEPPQYRFRSGPSPEGRFPVFRQVAWGATLLSGVAGLVWAVAGRLVERRRSPRGAPFHLRSTPWLLIGLFVLYPSVHALAVMDVSRRLLVEPYVVLLAAFFAVRVYRLAGRRFAFLPSFRLSDYRTPSPPREPSSGPQVTD